MSVEFYEKSMRRVSVIRDKNVRKGKSYPRWIARWREKGNATSHYLGKCDEMTEEVALKKALEMKADYLMEQARVAYSLMEGLGLQLARGDPALIADLRRRNREGLEETEAAIRRGMWARMDAEKEKKNDTIKRLGKGPIFNHLASCFWPSGPYQHIACGESPSDAGTSLRSDAKGCTQLEILLDFLMGGGQAIPS